MLPPRGSRVGAAGRAPHRKQTKLRPLFPQPQEPMNCRRTVHIVTGGPPAPAAPAAQRRHLQVPLLIRPSISNQTPGAVFLKEGLHFLRDSAAHNTFNSTFFKAAWWRYCASSRLCTEIHRVKTWCYYFSFGPHRLKTRRLTFRLLTDPCVSLPQCYFYIFSLGVMQPSFSS